MTMLGQMTLSAIPDLSRIIAEHGLKDTFKIIRHTVGNIKGIKMSMKEAQKLGVGLELILGDARIRTLMDINDPFSFQTPMDRFLQSASDKFGKFSLMTYWNNTLKKYSAVMTQDKIIEDSIALAKGKLSKKKIRELRGMGIDMDTAIQISKNFQQYGENYKGLRVGNVDQWPEELRNAFSQAVIRQTDLTIVTPGVGTMPTMATSTPLGQLIFQFKSFAFASHQQIWLRRLNNLNANHILGVLVGTMLGGVAMELKSFASGKKDDGSPRVKVPDFQENTGDWALKALDASGYFTLFGEVNNMSDKLLGVSLDDFVEDGTAARPYNHYNKVSTILGPWLNTADNALEVVRGVKDSMGEEGWDTQNTKALRRLILGQNLFWLREGFNIAEDEFNDILGVD